ncbi:MAG: DMT family transporter [Thermomicrobiales bacterium]
MRVTFWLLVGTALLMGCFMAIQPAINGQLRFRVGSPAQAAMISTSVSTISLLTFVLLVQRPSWPDGEIVRSTPWWVWTGGLLGAVYVAASIVLVQRLSAAVAFSLVILGQMICALILDHFGWLGLRDHEITPGRLLGAGLVVAGVALIRLL